MTETEIHELAQAAGRPVTFGGNLSSLSYVRGWLDDTYEEFCVLREAGVDFEPDFKVFEDARVAQ